MKYGCRDCFRRFSDHYVFWICRSGEYICESCFYKDDKLRRDMGIPARVVIPTVACVDYKMTDCYVLEGTNFRRAKDMNEWAEYMNSNASNPLFRHVALDNFYINSSEYCSLSTVFLGIDHNFGFSGGPVLFESMIFGGELDDSMKRYRTWEEAKSGHFKIWMKINKRIHSRHKVHSIDTKKEEKMSNNYYTLKVKGFVCFNNDDLRLIREN